MNIIHRHVPNPNANGTHRRKKRENAETVVAQRVRRFLMAFPARLERAAFRLGGEPSIQLRYGNVFLFKWLGKAPAFA